MGTKPFNDTVGLNVLKQGGTQKIEWFLLLLILPLNKEDSHFKGKLPNHVKFHTDVTRDGFTQKGTVVFAKEPPILFQGYHSQRR